MDDNRIFHIRNGLLIAAGVLALAVMWANVIGLGGVFSVLVHFLLLLSIGGLAYTVKVTGFDSLTNTILPLVVIGVLVVATLIRFGYAMSYGD